MGDHRLYFNNPGDNLPPDERQAGALTGEAADHLDPPAGLAEGALDEIGVPDAVPVLSRGSAGT